nr:hypothetical protein [Streptomyces graminofaciens]
MQTRGRGLKFASVIAVVVLALTGFSSGKGHGGTSSSGSSGGSGDGSGGGGCSSSSQDHDSSSSSSGGTTSGLGKSDDDDDDSYDGNDSYDDSDSYGEPTADALQDAHVKLISCATVKAPYATVEVRNPNAVDASFDVAVLFEEAGGTKSMGKVDSIEVPAKDKVTAKIEVDDLRRLKLIDHCEVEENAPQS